jgi:hypothetical protein
MWLLQKLKAQIKICLPISALENISKLKTGETSVQSERSTTKTSILGFWPKKATSPENGGNSEILAKRPIANYAEIIPARMEKFPPLPPKVVLQRQNTSKLTRVRSLEVLKPADISPEIFTAPMNSAAQNVKKYEESIQGTDSVLNKSFGAPFYELESPTLSNTHANPNEGNFKITENIKYAETLGKQLFKDICPRKQKELTRENFQRFFKSEELTDEVFKLFDRDENGSISREEFIFSLTVMYKEKRDLALSVNDLTQALGNLNKIMTVFSVICAAMISFPLFGISVDALLPFSSVLLAVSFIFGGYARVTFECIIFLFVVHPYDTGDRIFFDDGSNFIVEELNLLTTTLGIDGRKFYVPNRNLKLILEVMATRTIMNTRRSGDMIAIVDLKVPIYTPHEQMLIIKNRMLEFAKNNPKILMPECGMNIAEMGVTNMMTYKFAITYKGNWQVFF